MTTWLRANPGQAIAFAVLLAVACITVWAVWRYGGLPPFLHCAAITQTGACPTPTA